MRTHVTNTGVFSGPVQGFPYIGVAQWLTPQLHRGCKHPVLRARELGRLLPLFNASSSASAISMVPAEYEDFTSSTICFTTPRSMRIVLASQSFAAGDFLERLEVDPDLQRNALERYELLRKSAKP
jgi:hypothetical protein